MFTIITFYEDASATYLYRWTIEEAREVAAEEVKLATVVKVIISFMTEVFLPKSVK